MEYRPKLIHCPPNSAICRYCPSSKLLMAKPLILGLENNRFGVFLVHYAYILGWVLIGTYLLSTISPDNLHEPLCRSVLIYLVVLYISLSVFLAACVVACLWKSMKNCRIKVDTFVSKCRHFNNYKLVKPIEDYAAVV